MSTEQCEHNMSTSEDCPFKNIIMPAATQLPPSRQHETIDLQMNTRVGKLEGVVETLTRDIQEVSKNVGLLGGNISSLKDVLNDSLTKIRDGFNNQIEVVTNRLTTSAQPQWQTISAFVALAITLLGMAGAVIGLLMSGQSDQVNSLKQDTSVITERMFLSQYEKGKSDAFSVNTSAHLSTLDTMLQREMKLINDTTSAKMQGLDDKLQMELELVRKNLELSIIDQKADIIELRKWRLDHAEADASGSAYLKAKQEMIIKKTEDLNDRQWNYRHDRLSAFEKLQIDTTFGKEHKEIKDAQP